MTLTGASMLTADTRNMDAASRVNRALILPICTLKSPSLILRWDTNYRDILVILLSHYIYIYTQRQYHTTANTVYLHILSNSPLTQHHRIQRYTEWRKSYLTRRFCFSTSSHLCAIRYSVSYWQCLSMNHKEARGRSSETSVPTCHITRRHVPEDRSDNIYVSEAFRYPLILPALQIDINHST
jgi:hypothetical protein